MSEHLFEETDAELTATITKGKPKSGTVKFIVKRDGTEESKEVTLDGDSAKWTYPLPKVDDAKDNYPLEYRIECDGQPYSGAQDYVIWPKNATLSAVNGTQAGFAGFKFKIMQDGAAIGTSKTEAGGASPAFTLRKPAAFTIEAIAPYEITKTVTGTGRNRKVEAKLSFEAEFSAPTGIYTDDEVTAFFGDRSNAPPEGTIHQFVNLRSANDGQDHKGNLLTIKIGVKGDRTRDPADRVGRAGVFAFIKVNFGPATKSKRSTPKTEVIDGLQLRERTEVKAGEQYTGKVELSGPEGKGEFKLNLGLAGGDECEVKIGGTDQYADATLKFINWRQLHYEIIYPKFMKPDLDATGKWVDVPAAVRSDVARLLKPLFVRYEIFKSKEFDATGLKGVVAPEFLGEDAGGRSLYTYAKGWLSEVSADKFDSTEKNCIKVRLFDKGFKEEESEQTHQPELTKLETDFPLGKGYYLKFGARTGSALAPQVTGPGTGWSVKIDDPTPHLKETELKWETETHPSTSGAVLDKIRIEELNLRPGAAPVTVEFRPNTAEIRDRDTGAIDDFMKSLLSRIGDLRKQNNLIKIKFTGEWGGPVAEARFSAIKTQVERAFRMNVKKVPLHPGLADDGTPLSGTVDASWIDHKSAKTVQIKLPVRSSASHPLLPGDIVGPDVSATRAPIVVKFKMKNCGGVNGNAGKGNQNMVLKDEDGLAMTIAHELGHAMGMTITDRMTEPTWLKKRPPGMPEAKHVDEGGPYYVSTTKDAVTGGRRKKHKGAHCAFGLAASLISQADWGKKTGTCIMWGAGSKTRTGYCDTCVLFLKARNLKDIHSEWDVRSDVDL